MLHLSHVVYGCTITSSTVCCLICCMSVPRSLFRSLTLSRSLSLFRPFCSLAPSLSLAHLPPLVLSHVHTRGMHARARTHACSSLMPVLSYILSGFTLGSSTLCSLICCLALPLSFLSFCSCVLSRKCVRALSSWMLLLRNNISRYALGTSRCALRTSAVRNLICCSSLALSLYP